MKKPAVLMVKAGLHPEPAGDRLSAAHLSPIDLLDAWRNSGHLFHAQARAVITQVYSYMQVWIQLGFRVQEGVA